MVGVVDSFVESVVVTWFDELEELDVLFSASFFNALLIAAVPSGSGSDKRSSSGTGFNGVGLLTWRGFLIEPSDWFLTPFQIVFLTTSPLLPVIVTARPASSGGF